MSLRALTLAASLLTVVAACSDKGTNSDTDGTTDEGTTDSTDTTNTTDTESGTTDTSSTETQPSDLLQFDGAPPTNVLMISLDTTRRDYLSPYDPLKSDFTPFIAERMAASVVLNNHRSCSNWTYASVLCVNMGQDNLDMGWVPTRGFAGVGEPPGPVPDGLVTLANNFSEQGGYVTSLVSTNAFLGSGYYNQQTFYDTIEILGEAPPADVVSEAALDALDEVRSSGDPWLFHVHYFDPHNPYDPPTQYRDGLDALPPIDYDLDNVGSSTALYNGHTELKQVELDLIAEHARILYGGELSYFDDQLSDFWGELEASGALEDTLVIFWTDHGEQFFEHGGFTHGEMLNAEETDAAVFFWAENLTPGTWDGPTSHEDLAPTILSAVGYEPGAEMTGVRIGIDEAPETRFTLAYSDRVRQSVDLDGKRLLFAWSGEIELYDYEADPKEENNLYVAGETDIQVYWDALLPQVEEMNALFPSLEYVAPEL